MNIGFLKKLKNGALKNKKWLLLGAGGLAILAFSLKGGAALPVTQHTAEKGDVRKIIEATATVESQTERTIQSRISGEVLEVMKGTGDVVEKGTVLAVVDVKDIDLSIKGLEAQKASLKSMMADADQPTPESLRRAEAQMNADAIALNAAKRSYEQAQQLFSAGAASTEELKAAEEDMNKAEQTAIISQASYSAVKNGLSPNQRARYQADIAAIQSQIDQVRVNRERFSISSPLTGVVTRKSIEPGQIILPGTPLFEIDDPASLMLTADILVQDAARITAGVPIRAFDEDSGIEITGKVKKIDPKAFSKLSDLGIEQKRVRIEITPAQVPASLRIGMELDLEVIEAQKENVLMLPDSAVFKLNGKSHVFLISGEVAKLTEVEIGLEGKDTVEVLSGLKVGDQVVDAPGNDLKDGAKVSIEK